MISTFHSKKYAVGRKILDYKISLNTSSQIHQSKRQQNNFVCLALLSRFFCFNKKCIVSI